MTYVYKHTFPNGKVYIGIADDYYSRWNDGRGYKDNAPMYEDIKKYGWNGITHEILKECDTRKEAEQLEQQLIIAYRSEDKDYGYNRTNYTEHLLNLTPRVIGKKEVKVKCIKTVTQQKQSHEWLVDMVSDTVKTIHRMATEDGDDYLNFVWKLYDRERLNLGVNQCHNDVIELTKSEYELLKKWDCRFGRLGWMIETYLSPYLSILVVQDKIYLEITKPLEEWYSNLDHAIGIVLNAMNKCQNTTKELNIND